MLFRMFENDVCSLLFQMLMMMHLRDDVHSHFNSSSSHCCKPKAMECVWLAFVHMCAHVCNCFVRVCMCLHFPIYLFKSFCIYKSCLLCVCVCGRRSTMAHRDCDARALFLGCFGRVCAVGLVGYGLDTRASSNYRCHSHGPPCRCPLRRRRPPPLPHRTRRRPFRAGAPASGWHWSPSDGGRSAPLRPSGRRPH